MESALSTIVCFVVIFDLLAIVLSAFIKDSQLMMASLVFANLLHK
jgi:hypothetical protein